MTDAFTKLSSGITESTIWSEPHSTRSVWVTMLAMADANGDVSASIPGLARRANATMEETEAALTCFLSPDPYSRTKDNEGRRIIEIDGGWHLLNHGAYRGQRDPEARRQQNREAQARYRANHAQSGNSKPEVSQSKPKVSNVSQGKPKSAQAEAEAEAEKENTPIVPFGDSSSDSKLEILPDEQATPPPSTASAEVIIDLYHRMLPKCMRMVAITPKRLRTIATAERIARKFCRKQGIEYEPGPFWEVVFSVCLLDPWLRGEVPNPRNPSWKQNLDVLLRDRQLGQILDRADELTQRAA